MSKISENERVYSMEIITYATPVEFSNLFVRCSHWAYILHDKDNCVPHYHLICIFYKNTSPLTVKKVINSACNTMCEKLDCKTSMYLYLTHTGEVGKYQYEYDAVVTNDRDYWFEKTTSKENENREFLSDLIALSTKDMFIKYGRDYARYKRQYDDFKAVILKEMEVEEND